MIYKILFTAAAEIMLHGIADTRIQQKLLTRIQGLTREPFKQGKSLLAELSHYRSIRAVGQRYRIIYRLEKTRVVIAAIEIRKEGSKKDIYHLAQKLVRQGLG